MGYMYSHPLLTLGLISVHHFVVVMSSITTVVPHTEFQVDQHITFTDHVEYVATRAIDGDTDTCSKMIGDNQWWKTTFKQRHNIAYINILKENRNGLHVKVEVIEDDKSNGSCTQNISTQNENTEKYTCTGNGKNYISGNGILISNEDNESKLVLCEIDIYQQHKDYHVGGSKEKSYPVGTFVGGSSSRSETSGVVILTASLFWVYHY